MTDWAWYQARSFGVPDRAWTAVLWDIEYEGANSLGLVIREDGLVTPPIVGTTGLFDLDIEVAWQNVHGVIPHRRKVRYRHGMFPWVSSDINSAITNGTEDDDIPQTQTVNMQPNDAPFYIEVYQNSGQTIDCVRFGVEAPSLMMARFGT